jgi:hypothetical protein
MVVCKTHRELNELVEALRISLKAYDAKLKQLGVDRSECDVNTVSDVFVSSPMISEWSTSTILKGAFGLSISPTQRRMVGDFTKRQPRRSRRMRRRIEEHTIACSNRRWSRPASVGVTQARAVCWRGEPDIGCNERARRRTGSRPSRFILASFTECTQGRAPVSAQNRPRATKSAHSETIRSADDLTDERSLSGATDALLPMTAFSHLPPVHGVELKGRLRVEGGHR